MDDELGNRMLRDADQSRPWAEVRRIEMRLYIRWMPEAESLLEALTR